MEFDDYEETRNKMKFLVNKRLNDLREEKKQLEEILSKEQDTVSYGIANRKLEQVEQLLEINFNFLSKISKVGEANENIH